MSSKTPQTALLLIDIQQGFKDPSHWGSVRSTPHFEQNIARLLEAFRAAENTHVLHVCHHSTFPGSPLHPSKPGAQFMEYATPLASERVFPKTTNSPFIETDLEKVIKSLEVDCLVIVGLMTAHCVSTTLRMASNLRVVDHSYGCVIKEGGAPASGKIFLLEDATATFNVVYGGKEYDAESVHAIHLASMKDEFCDIGTTDEILKAIAV
ncbi:putative isochorismatase family protein [Lachnellula suecica]|uniref:Putative isochorismatase family protein n=1 Tax=Lachnellula suecica TaxID=602035 RepID=A0A8T9C8C4_9HELO|nr:putative isochorismatase family protein [Lachnellula suecica]